MSVGKSQCRWHMLGPSNFGYSLYGLSRHGKLGPMVAADAGASSEAHEPVAALCVSSWAKANSASSTFPHVVGMFFMGLYIGTKFQANVLVISKFASGH
eukprot:scaffold7934_cov160-Cylindrotheca_fusiformis.AAC.1